MQQRENSGALFKNDKQGVENRPDYKGDVNVNGVEYWISAWLKEGKNGKFMSLSFQPKQKPGSVSQPQANRPKGPAAVADMEDNVPF